MIKSLWKLESDSYFLTPISCDSVSAARADIADYPAWYNAQRAHSRLDRLTPDEGYFAGLPRLKLAE